MTTNTANFEFALSVLKYAGMVVGGVSGVLLSPGLFDHLWIA